MPLHVEVVAAERSLLSDDVDEILAQTLQGQIGILPHHAPLLTLLAPGEMRLKKGNDEQVLAVGGGFLEVGSDNQVVVLADSAERAEEVDVGRAEEARRRAAQRLDSHSPEIDYDRAQAALARSLARLRAAERVRRYPSRGAAPPTMPAGTPGLS